MLGNGYVIVNKNLRISQNKDWPGFSDLRHILAVAQEPPFMKSE